MSSPMDFVPRRYRVPIPCKADAAASPAVGDVELRLKILEKGNSGRLLLGFCLCLGRSWRREEEGKWWWGRVGSKVERVKRRKVEKTKSAQIENMDWVLEINGAADRTGLPAVEEEEEDDDDEEEEEEERVEKTVFFSQLTEVALLEEEESSSGKKMRRKPPMPQPPSPPLFNFADNTIS
ncbi:hypothetical protein Dimus_002013, partial [Dionaea muscipula]